MVLYRENAHPAPMPPPPRTRKPDKMFHFQEPAKARDSGCYTNVQDCQHLRNPDYTANWAEVVTATSNVYSVSQ